MGETSTPTSSSTDTSTSTAIRDLRETPTWVVATICFCLILISIILERTLHFIVNWLKKHRKKTLVEAVEKLKSELMLLGFISLVLVVLQGPISSICIPMKIADTMPPCSKASLTIGLKFMVTQHLKKFPANPFHFNAGYEDGLWHPHRLLVSESATTTVTCSAGKVPLISVEGVHQLHIFIFVLASTQLLYSLLTMGLGRAKMRRWKAWEEETQSISYQVANDPARFRFTRETTFGRRHLGIWTRLTVLLWIKSFFRQFFNSVAKVDYLTLRHGFINAHMPSNTSFNFRKYIQRSLEEDFKVVIGISPSLWLVVVMLLLGDVNGLHLYLWVAYIPLIIVLVLGTKLEVILARMALQLKDQTTVVKGAPLVQPDDNLFWFGNPRFVLSLIHFTMFMNAFELAFFLWATWQFGLNSCYHESVPMAVTRGVLALIVQIISSYITLPIYALVTQMGSQYKSAVLEEQTIESVRRWHARAKKKKQESSSHRPLISRPNSEFGSSRMTSPMETSSAPTTPRHTTTPAETFSSPWDEISEVKSVPGDANVSSGAVVVELSALK
ncbi:MLO-like protein 3 [Macadamia integrifolia]|uniref:MLO-like protein 3 n=1 Tax=Macadamia integrifolia TaxID=60698 RepID=UPI001C5342EE|nr:MLO-like protein 3 [Macadamia integrifolia]